MFNDLGFDRCFQLGKALFMIERKEILGKGNGYRQLQSHVQKIVVLGREVVGGSWAEQSNLCPVQIFDHMAEVIAMMLQLKGIFCPACYPPLFLPHNFR